MAENTITFKLIPNMNKPLIRESRVRLRALFDYDPVGDKYIPCKEAGLSFHKGDILHIVSQDDPYWYEFILSKAYLWGILGQWYILLLNLTSIGFPNFF